MSLGTIAFDKNIYNLDHMTSEELEDLLNNIESEKNRKQKEIKKMLK